VRPERDTLDEWCSGLIHRLAERPDAIQSGHDHERCHGMPARTRQLLALLACPEAKGSAVLRRQRRRSTIHGSTGGTALSTDPRDARRRVRDGRRRRARAPLAKAAAEGSPATSTRARAPAAPHPHELISPTAGTCSGNLPGCPEQLETSASQAMDVPGLPSPEGLGAVVVPRMGGSGVAGEIFRRSARTSCAFLLCWSATISCRRSSSSSLVFAVSFSGETEETLEAAETALPACEAHPR